MGQRSWRRWLVVGALAVAALVGAFALGRASAPDTTAPGRDCSKEPRYAIDVPAQFGRTAYFSLCEQQAAFGKLLGQPATAMKIYAGPTGSKVVGWHYPDCTGLPDGVVPVGTKHPDVCPGSGTTVSGTTP